MSDRGGDLFNWINAMKPSEIAEAYRKYLWPKCSRTTFYTNIRKWMPINEAIKPVPHEKRYKPWRVKTKKFSEELEWYVKQEWDKVPRNRFYQRLYQGWSKERAIQTWPITIERKKKPFRLKIVYKPTAIPQKKAKLDEDIKIRYTEDEARVFCVEYENMINKLQEQYCEAEWDEAREISKRLDKLVKEYQTFKLYNNNE